MIARSRALWTLAVAACCVVALSLSGAGAESRLHQTSLSVPGTESARTEILVRRYFGESETFVILLKGPVRDLRDQGRRLVRVLEADSQVTVISPWGPSSIPQLRSRPRSALILVNFRVPPEEAVRRVVPHLERLLARLIQRPVIAIQSGYPSISRAIQDEAKAATRRGEMIAVPLVLVVLLLVFRSPVAALIPLIFGAATVIGARGILVIAANWVTIDAFALTVTTMMGLALGVDYALLMVSRFREELATGKSVGAAAMATKETAGRTVLFAGGALLVSMLASALILPGTFLISLAGAVVVVTGVSVALGVLVVPALLTLVGARIDRWSIVLGHQGLSPVALSDRLLRNPGVAVAVLTVPLVLLALPAISLAVGPPSIDQLPATNRTRLATELINREVGPGWAGPYVVLLASEGEPITSDANLGRLRRWERAVNGADDVEAVIGPGRIAARVRSLGKLGRSFLGQGQPGSQAAQLQHLGAKLGSASRGLARLRGGVDRTASGAALLAAGSENLGQGAGDLATGLVAASTGGEQVASDLDRVASGSHRLHTGQRRAVLAAQALKLDLGDAVPRLRRSVNSSRRLIGDLEHAQNGMTELGTGADDAQGALDLAVLELQKLPGVSGDPHYAAALEAVDAARRAIVAPTGITAGLQNVESHLIRASERADIAAPTAAGGLEQLQTATSLATRLAGGLSRLERGSSRLDSGATALARSTEALAAGLPRLAEGAGAMSEGAKELTVGADSLASGLGEAYARSGLLEADLGRAATRSLAGGSTLIRQSTRLRRLSPMMFDSGYLNLAALDGTPPDVQSRIAQALNVERGGQAARILVVPRGEGATKLEERLRESAPRLARRLGGVAGVTGGRAELHDYARVSKQRLPIVILVVSLLTFLSLVFILRALLAPALTVLLNLLSVSVAFGVLALLADLPSGAPIGNWSHIDTIGAVAIFAIAFGVSIDYSVFILVRIREQLSRGANHEQAVRIGLRRTGGVVTGAALMMVAVFATFATSNLAIVSQLGAGLTVAILVDATVIRLILLPALLLWIGERCWWLPLRPSG